MIPSVIKESVFSSFQNLQELTHMFGNLIDTPVNLSYPRTILSRINPNKHRRMVEEAKCVDAFVTLKVGD